MSNNTDDFMAMKGAGYYSRATIGAKHVMDNATGLILNALDRLPPKDDGSVFLMTDMGCADGGTSIDMVKRILREIRERCPTRPIQMTYTDLPKTDFSQLFQIVHGLTPTETYMDDIADLYVSASATSFHKRIVPPGTLDLGHSATASHYITEVPAKIENHVHMVRASGAVRQAYEDKGAADWVNFLLMRASELRKGGVLALFNFGIDEDGRWLGHTGGVTMFDEFNRHWHAMSIEGKISPAEYRATNFPQVYRTVEQFTAPFTEETSAVRRAGLTLEHVETRVVRCPFAAAWKNGEYSSAAEFAQSYIPTLRSWSEPVFANALSKSRSADERAELVDEFYGRYEKAVATSPEGHAMDYVHCYLICRKE
ncbi:MAG: class I SAM-dependent methyltransferase [Marinovum sp.]|nr:class I SAM-dependent methyltransferase [Marinovum sp.]